MHHGVATVTTVDAIGDAADAAPAARRRRGRRPPPPAERPPAHGARPRWRCPGSPPITVREGDHLAGYAQLALINGIRNIELVVAPADRGDDTIARRLLAAAVDAVAADGGGPVQWWAFDATEADDRARRVGRADGDPLAAADAPAAADRHARRRRDAGVRARAGRGRLPRRQQPGVRVAPRTGRVDPRDAGAAGGRAVVRPGRLPPPRARRTARGVLLDEAAPRRAPRARRDLRDRRRSRLPGPQARQPADARRAGLDRRARRHDRDPLRRRRQHRGGDDVRAPRLHRPPHRPRLHPGRGARDQRLERYGVDRAALGALLADVPRYRADQVWSGLYEQPRHAGGDDEPARRRCGPASPRRCRRRSRRSPSRSATPATPSSSCGSSTAAPASRPC